MKKIIIILSGVFLSEGMEAQQDPQYNLYQFNQMVINPAYAGSRDGISAVASNRQQWVGFDGAPKTTCASVHGPILNKNLGLGLTLVNDMMGPRNVTSVYGNFAYILKLTPKMRLSFGLNAGYNRYQFNFDKIGFKDTEVPSQLLTSINKGTLDINGGLYLKAKSFFVGFSATHINTPTVYSYTADNALLGKFSYRLGTHMFLTAGYSFVLDKDLVFAPTILVKAVGNSMSMDVNANFFLYKKMWLGVFYRNGYGPGGLISYYITNQFRVGLSYDTGLKNATRLGPSFEGMIGFDIAGSKSKIINPRFL